MVEALKAADELAKENIYIRVMDPFTLKPLDNAAIIKHAKAVGGKILTVEDHYVEGKSIIILFITATNFAMFSCSKFSRHFCSEAVGSCRKHVAENCTSLQFSLVVARRHQNFFKFWRSLWLNGES